MNYKETLFFIGKCLTISSNTKNLQEITSQIQSEEFDWDSVVKVSTAHFVFPTLYCHLKEQNLLSHLPEELVSYMEHITEINRDRNQQIIDQAKEIYQWFNAQGIELIFLKGTGFLLEDLYSDIGERMVGDIDFLVSDVNFEKAIALLKENSYKENSDLDRTFANRHYTKMVHPKRIAAVEIHHSMTSGMYARYFNLKASKKV